MQAILDFLASIDTGVFVTIFGLFLSAAFISIMTLILTKSLKGRDVTRLMIDPTTGYLSQHKFWSNIAFLLGSVAFIKFNFNSTDSPYLVEIWAIYLTVIGGVDVFSSWMRQKTRVKELEHGYGRYDEYRKPYEESYYEESNRRAYENGDYQTGGVRTDSYADSNTTMDDEIIKVIPTTNKSDNHNNY